ncbi:hypothetical protein ACSV4D_16510 [Flavobacterium sp. ARAG 55.4]|uniref:hypothetical protein n=1 Tax=Flavobacterium sp. ARAG 55.4 TaxID=3451357 RepID=UPI003F479DA8
MHSEKNSAHTEQYFKIVREKLRFNSVFFLTGLLTVSMCGFFWLNTDSFLSLNSIPLFAIVLIINGSSETFFSIINKNNFESWGLLLQSGIYAVLVGVLFLLIPFESINVQVVILLYLFLAAIFNLIFTGALKQYGMVNWNSFITLNKIVVIVSLFTLIFEIKDFEETDLLLYITLICFGFSKVLLGRGFSELNTFNEKISWSIYHKIDVIKNEYFKSLERNWDAERDLYI